MLVRQWFEAVILGGDELLKSNPNYGMALPYAQRSDFMHRPSVLLSLEAVFFNLALPILNKKLVRTTFRTDE